MKQTTNDEDTIRQVAGGGGALPSAVQNAIEHASEAMRRARNDGGVHTATGLPREVRDTLSWAGGRELVTRGRGERDFSADLRAVAGAGGEQVSASEPERFARLTSDSNENAKAPGLGSRGRFGVDEIAEHTRGRR